MSSYSLKLVICVASFVGYTFAQDNEDMLRLAQMDNLKRFYLRLIMECMEQHPLTEESLGQLKEHRLPDDENVKCLFACAFKRGGIMDNNGFLSVSGIYNLTQTFVPDLVMMEKSMKFAEACKTVNEVAVTDGARGCDRAALIFNCSANHDIKLHIGV